MLRVAFAILIPHHPFRFYTVTIDPSRDVTLWPYAASRSKSVMPNKMFIDDSCSMTSHIFFSFITVKV